MPPKGTKKLPAVPKAVWSSLGQVDVELVANLTEDGTGQHLCGQYDSSTRQIRLRTDMHPSTLWQTLYHEICHMVLTDAGVQLSKEQEESVCDAIATYGVSLMLARASGNPLNPR